MSAYFNLEKSFAFYGAYHYNRVNQIIHIICVPIIFTTSIEILLRFVSPFIVQTLVAFYGISFVMMDRLAGIAYLPMIYLMYLIATNVLSTTTEVSSSGFLIAWLLQFIGHGVFEKRAPALLTNLPQSLHAAVFFVWLEVLFALGFRRPLRLKLEAAVEKERTKYRAPKDTKNVKSAF